MGCDGFDSPDILGRLKQKLAPLGQVDIREPEADVKTLMNFISQTLSVPTITMRVHRRFRMPRLQPESFMQMNDALSQFLGETGTELLRSVS
jgi:hypothetical protein